MNGLCVTLAVADAGQQAASSYMATVTFSPWNVCCNCRLFSSSKSGCFLITVAAAHPYNSASIESKTVTRAHLTDDFMELPLILYSDGYSECLTATDPPGFLPAIYHHQACSSFIVQRARSGDE
jgi:hypothetical protein